MLSQSVQIRESFWTNRENELYRVTQKKRELLKNPTKIEEIQEKKIYW